MQPHAYINHVIPEEELSGRSCLARGLKKLSLPFFDLS